MNNTLLDMFRIYPFIAFIFISLTCWSQSDSSPQVPDEVIKSFNRRFPRAEDVSWNKVDTAYKVDFFFKDRLSYAEFRGNGDWVMTIVDEDLYDLYPPIERYIDENFRKYKILFVEKAVRADKDDFYYAQLSKKVKGRDEPLIVELIFDKTGRIEQVNKPEGFDDMTIPGIDEPEDVIPEAVVDAWKKRFPRAEQLSWTTVNNTSDSIDFNYMAKFVYRDKPTKAEFLPNGDWYLTKVKLEENDLYRPITRYLEANYDKDKILLAEKVTRFDRDNHYHVKLEHEEAYNEETVIFDLYFDRSGRIMEIDRPRESLNMYLLTVDLPEEVQRKFRGRFARAEEVTWEQEDTLYTGRFIYRDKHTTAVFSDSGMWVETVQEEDTRDLYNPIDRYLDEHYRNYKVSYCEKVTRHDRDDYYYLELISKKKSVTPKQLSLYFDKMGRIRDDK